MSKRRDGWERHVDEPDPPWLNVIAAILSFRWLLFLLLLPVTIPLILWAYLGARPTAKPWTPPPPSRRPSTLRTNCIACRSDHLQVVLRIADTFGENNLAHQRKTLVRCLDCGLVYVEYNAFDSFCAFSHDAPPNYDEWHRLPADAADAMLVAVTRMCPAALDPRCGCALHAALREVPAPGTRHK